MRPNARLIAVALTLSTAAGCANAAAGSGSPDAGAPDTARVDPRAALCADPSASAPPYWLVQKIFDDNCTTCHSGAQTMVDLVASQSWGDLVGQPAPAPDTCGGTLVTPGQPDASYLLQKLTLESPCYGAQMPLGEFLSDPLPGCVTAIVRAWIAEGAPAPLADAGVD